MLAPTLGLELARAGERAGEFRADCLFSHRKMDDPIVRPGLPGAFHSHDFFGNRSTDARSTLRSLRRARTSCEPEVDRSAYWVPTLYGGGGRPVTATRLVGYYVTSNKRPDRVRPYPLGLMMIAGDGKARGPQTPLVVGWGCSGAGRPSTPSIGRCPKGSELDLDLRFPDCWNGRDLDSTDHRSHMAYSAAGACPATHPVAVPELTLKLTYPTRGSPAMRLASGRGYTAHGDFINAWEPRELARPIRDCLVPAITCDPYGEPE
ncbi:MAG: DUF1996 domain-containing protein [Solirubrobacteraceae bacterium]